MNNNNVKQFSLKRFFKISDVKCKLWLCIPAVVTGIFDSVVTLLGQPSEYWGRQFNHVSEFNPVAHLALTTHPLA